MDEFEVYRRGQLIGGPLHTGTADDLAVGLLPRCSREALLAVALEALRLYVRDARPADPMARARALGWKVVGGWSEELEAEAVAQGMGTDEVRGELTDRQRAVLREIVRHWGEHGCSPTLRELCEALDISSPNGVVAHLEPLAAKGWIVWQRTEQGAGTRSRGVVVPELLAAAKAAADAYLEGLT